MSKRAKLLAAVRQNPAGVRYSDLVSLIEALGYSFVRQKGSHAIYVHSDAAVPMVNVQGKGGMAKVYQVVQVLEIVDKYKLEV